MPVALSAGSGDTLPGRHLVAFDDKPLLVRGVGQ
jgi:hypothetical protein